MVMVAREALTRSTKVGGWEIDGGVLLGGARGEERTQQAAF